MYAVGKVSVPVASAILGFENVANQLPETCESVIVCFMLGSPLVEAVWRVPFGGCL